MYTVNFQYENEFAQEMQLDKGKIDRGIVRLTYLQETTKRSPLRLLYLVCTYTVNDQLVKLRRYFGELSGMDQETTRDSAIIQDGMIAYNLIKAKCMELDLEVRSGILAADSSSDEEEDL